MRDLTNGKPLKLIFLFMLPILLGNLFQQAYNLADTVIIGQKLGNSAIAAVGATSSVVSMMFSLINGLVTGFAVVVSKNFGAGNHTEMHRTIARMLVFSGMFTAVIIIAVTAFIDPLLNALNTPENIYHSARSYLFVITLGLVVTLMYNFEASVLRAVGDTVVPLVILIISTVLNILLDLLLVFVFELGVTGAALATVAAQFVSSVGCLVYLIKRRPFLLVKRSDFSFNKKAVAELIGAGLGMSLMYSIVDMGTVILQNGINGFGEEIITAHTAARRLFFLLNMPLSSVSATMVTFCSQNRGAGKYSRIKAGIRDGLFLSACWSTIAVALVYTAGHFLAGVLIAGDGPDSAAIIDTAVLYLRLNIPFFYPLTALLTLRASLQGLGKSVVPIVCSIIELTWKVVTVALIIPLFGGNTGTVGSSAEAVGGYFGVIISEPIIWTSCAVFIVIIAVITLRKLPENFPLIEEEVSNK